MSILEMQRVLTRVFTSEEFRQSFLADAEAACGAYDLTARELKSLKALDGERVGNYALILREVRFELALRAFPLTQSLLPDDFHKFAGRYVREYPPTTTTGAAMFREATTLYRFVLKLAEEGELNVPYLRDVMKYEKNLFSVGNRLEASLSANACSEANAVLPPDFTERAIGHLRPLKGAHVETGSFGYDVLALISQLSRGEEPRLSEERTYVLFHKVPGDQGVKVSKINAATRDLIGLCDGTRATAEVISELAARREVTSAEGRAELSCRCLKMFRALADANVIGFPAPKPAAADG